jgi:hypothetical protein
VALPLLQSRDLLEEPREAVGEGEQG